MSKVVWRVGEISCAAEQGVAPKPWRKQKNVGKKPPESYGNDRSKQVPFFHSDLLFYN